MTDPDSRAELDRTWAEADGAYRGLAVALGVDIEGGWEPGGEGARHTLWCAGDLDRDRGAGSKFA